MVGMEHDACSLIAADVHEPCDSAAAEVGRDTFLGPSDGFCQQAHPEMGVATAHAGILAASKAIWEDLEEHGILSVLLDPAQREDMHAETDAGERCLGSTASLRAKLLRSCHHHRST